MSSKIRSLADRKCLPSCTLTRLISCVNGERLHNRENMLNLQEDFIMDLTETDKLTELYSLRIPEITKAEVDRLPAALQKKLNHEILITIAKVIHESKFDPNLYLKS